MPNFTIRVELKGRDLTSEEYEKLHKLMLTLHFGRHYPQGSNYLGNQRLYDLPTGLYYGEASGSSEEIAQQVKKYVSLVRDENLVFVAETKSVSAL